MTDLQNKVGTPKNGWKGQEYARNRQSLKSVFPDSGIPAFYTCTLGVFS